jgi:hypothetical protein
LDFPTVRWEQIGLRIISKKSVGQRELFLRGNPYCMDTAKSLFEYPAA